VITKSRVTWHHTSIETERNWNWTIHRFNDQTIYNNR
jgi:hypothetical protein